MKKYARLRSTSSLPEPCEPSDEGRPEVASTTFSLDDDTSAVPGKWSSLKLSPPAYGDDAPSSSSHRVLADALKKLSSLRETHHDIHDPLPRGVSAATPHSWRTRIVRDSDAGGGDPQSTFSGKKIWLLNLSVYIQLEPECTSRFVCDEILHGWN
jgi:hypothetical protein